MQRFERTVEVDAPAELVFDLFSNFEDFPEWMGGVRDVRRTGPRRHHWVCETALGIDAEWEAETTHYEPDRRLVWRSVSGDVDADGEAVFSETGDGMTVVRVVLGYDTPGGRTGPEVERFFGWHPARRLEEDLEGFRRFAERQARRTGARKGAGRRPGARTRVAGRRGEARGDDGSQPPPREAERERRFEEALREARRGQDEGGRDYEGRRERDEASLRDDERYRDEGRFAEARGRRRFADERERGGRYGEADEGTRERRRGRGDGGDDEGEYRPRYALTPRERERQEGRRYPDPAWGESARALRRGVDRLLDEPPSRRFRRGPDGE